MGPWDRLEQARAEPHVGEPGTIVPVDAEGQVRSCPWALGVVPDPGEDPLDTVTERLECRGEQHSVFVAVSASEMGDELGLDAVEIYGDAAAQHQIEVLERDR